LLKSELLEIISNGENSGVEFKRDDIRPEQLAREIVALANLKGGYILLGVEDDGTISGITRSNLSEWMADTVFGRYVHPQILPYYEEMNDGKALIDAGLIEKSLETMEPFLTLEPNTIFRPPTTILKRLSVKHRKKHLKMR